MNKVRQEILIIVSPSQDHKHIPVQIKAFSHLAEHIVGPVPLTMFREICQGQIVGGNYIFFRQQTVSGGEDIHLVSDLLGILIG